MLLSLKSNYEIRNKIINIYVYKYKNPKTIQTRVILQYSEYCISNR